MIEPFSATIIGGALINVGCGLITNFVEPGRQAALHGVLRWWEKGKTPANHDVLKVTHEAHVAAMRVMAKRAAYLAEDEDKATAKALAELCDDPAFQKFRWDGEHLPLAETGARIDALFDRRQADNSLSGWDAYNLSILDDLSHWGIARTPNFDALFMGQVEGFPPWHLCFREHFAEMLKADARRPEGERAFRILTFEALNELRGMGAELVEGLAGLRADVAAGNAVGADTNAMVRQLVEAMQANKRAGTVSDEALIALASKIADKVADPQQALAELDRAIDEFLRLREQAARGTNFGDLVDQALRNIAAANDRGDLDAGAKTGADAFADWQEQQAAAKAAGLRLIEANIEQHRLRFDAKEMANWICEWLKIESGTLASDALSAEQGRWYQLAFVRGLRLELDVSILLGEQAVALARDKFERASATNDLAVCLKTQGERTGGAEGLALLSGAAAAFEDAANVHTASTFPANWAKTQHNLGETLYVQGGRSGGPAAIALFARAIAAFEAALTVWTRTSMPAEWAATQDSIGNTFRTQGEQTGGLEGYALLARAAAAAEGALSVYTFEDMPQQWAATQANLACTLTTQGEYSEGSESLTLLERAVAALDAALTVHTRDAMPFHWAVTQSALGNALVVLSQRTGGAESEARLRRAIVAYENALLVHTSDSMPADWSATQNNLGNALSELGERTDGAESIASLIRAEAAYEQALTVRDRQTMPVDWAMTQNNLGVALWLRGERTEGNDGLALLVSAVAACEEALNIRTPDTAPADWAMTQWNIAAARMSQAKKSEATAAREYLQAAAEAASRSLEVFTSEHMPFYHEKATRLLAEIEARLAALD